MNLKLVGQSSKMHQWYYNQNNLIHVCMVHFDYLYLIHFPIYNLTIYVNKCLIYKCRNKMLKGNHILKIK